MQFEMKSLRSGVFKRFQIQVLFQFAKLKSGEQLLLYAAVDYALKYY